CGILGRQAEFLHEPGSNCPNGKKSRHTPVELVLITFCSRTISREYAANCSDVQFANSREDQLLRCRRRRRPCGLLQTLKVGGTEFRDQTPVHWFAHIPDGACKLGSISC